MDRPAVLLATADPHLLAEVQRLAASVGIGVVPVVDGGGLLRRWQTAPLVLLGADLVPSTADLRPPRRSGVVRRCGWISATVLWAISVWTKRRLTASASCEVQERRVKLAAARRVRFWKAAMYST